MGMIEGVIRQIERALHWEVVVFRIVEMCCYSIREFYEGLIRSLGVIDSSEEIELEYDWSECVRGNAGW